MNRVDYKNDVIERIIEGEDDPFKVNVKDKFKRYMKNFKPNN